MKRPRLGPQQDNDNYKRLTTKILEAQDRRQALCDTNAWIAFLDIEELSTARVNIVLTTVARWAFHEGRRHQRHAIRRG